MIICCTELQVFNQEILILCYIQRQVFIRGKTRLCTSGTAELCSLALYIRLELNVYKW